MREIVKFNNELNNVSFKQFNERELNLLMTLCSRVRDKNTSEVTLTFKELKELSKTEYRSKEEFIKAILQVNKKLLETNCYIETEDAITQFALFTTFETSKKTETLTVSVNARFAYLLNALQANFTRFELAEFVTLKGKYQKTLYRLLKQFKSTGELFICLDDFRARMGIPDAIENRYIARDIIKPCMETLSEYFKNLDYEPIKASKQGRQITGYKFTFVANGQIPGQMTIDEAMPQTRPESMKDDAKLVNATKTKASKNKFHEFQQREYTDKDYDDLETRKLTQRQ